VLRSNLSSVPANTISALLEEVRSKPTLDLAQMDRFMRTMARDEKSVMRNFQELLYHMFGARIVNCESSLPQENYIDYSLADMSTRRTHLSEWEIFWKLFLESALEALSLKPLPIEMLDVLTFDDIRQLRVIATESSFIKKYNRLIQIIVERYRHMDEGDILRDMEEIQRIYDGLVESWRSILEGELESFATRRMIEAGVELKESGVSIGLGLAGLIPFLGNIASGVSVIRDSPSFITNLAGTYRNRGAVRDRQIYVDLRNRQIHKIIEQSDISDRATFLEFVELISRTIAERIVP